ncbi:MAG TPA: hypothetical protein VNE63_09215 [Candidatus Acidoferrales bacterium]|nr:hypothetical protein [Candidatus Acidoferrales bacterium]
MEIRMSRSSHRANYRVLSILLSVLGILVLCRPATAQDLPGPIATVQEFLLSIYPEMRGKKLVLSIETNGAINVPWTSLPPLTFQVGPAELGHTHIVQRGGQSIPMTIKPILSGMFYFDVEGRITHMNVEGPAITKESLYEAIRDRIQAHPQWSDNHIVQTLKEAGAKYGPNDKTAFLSVIPLGELEKFFGPLQVESAEFQLTTKDHIGSFALLFWEVEIKTTEQNGQSVEYSMAFEPFVGRLTSFSRVPPNR